MAGRGPAPKDPSQRRRRNKAPQTETLPPDTAAPPALPRKYKVEIPTKEGPIVRERTFLKATREWYEDWTQSSPARRFSRVHWRRLQMVVAPLVDQFNRLPTKELAAEIRLQEAEFGGSPYSLRRLGQEIGDPDEKGGAPERDLAPVRRLRAVDPGAVAGS